MEAWWFVWGEMGGRGEWVGEGGPLVLRDD